MYCSNKNFLNISKNTGVHDKDIYSLLSAVLVLLKKYGNLLKLADVQETISKVDTSIAKFIRLLQKLHKLDTWSVSEMLRLLEKETSAHTFSMRTSHPDLMSKKIIPFLEKKFTDTQVDIKESKTTELQVSGNGWYYKRSLERDLDKMLK